MGLAVFKVSGFKISPLGHCCKDLSSFYLSDISPFYGHKITVQIVHTLQNKTKQKIKSFCEDREPGPAFSYKMLVSIKTRITTSREVVHVG